MTQQDVPYEKGQWGMVAQGYSDEDHWDEDPWETGAPLPNMIITAPAEPQKPAPPAPDWLDPNLPLDLEWVHVYDLVHNSPTSIGLTFDDYKYAVVPSQWVPGEGAHPATRSVSPPYQTDYEFYIKASAPFESDYSTSVRYLRYFFDAPLAYTTYYPGREQVVYGNLMAVCYWRSDWQEWAYQRRFFYNSFYSHPVTANVPPYYPRLEEYPAPYWDAADDLSYGAFYPGGDPQVNTPTGLFYVGYDIVENTYPNYWGFTITHLPVLQYVVIGGGGTDPYPTHPTRAGIFVGQL